jgi:hypothetical protein
MHRILLAAGLAAGLALLGAGAAAESDDMDSGSHTGMGMMMGRGMGQMMEHMGGCPMMGGMMGGGRMGAHSEGRIAFLMAELAITEKEKSAWEAYAGALRKNLESMQSMRREMIKSPQAKSPVDRLDRHIRHMEERVGALKEIKEPLAHLYDALSDEQKKRADELLTGMGCMM